MKTFTINLPEAVEIDEREMKTFLAAKLYEKGSLSLGQAADLAGYSKRTFMELLGNYEVSIFNLSEKELIVPKFELLKNDEELTKMCMSISANSLNEDWENEDDAHWQSFLKD